MKYLIIIFCACHFVFAAELTFSQKMKPYAQKIIGQKWATKLFGGDGSILMPQLPTIDTDARSTKIYENQRVDNEISRDKAQKYDLLYLSELYDVVYDSMLEAQDSVYARWVNVMSQGATREGVYRAIVLDHNYLQLENGPSKLNPQAVDFVKSFMEKYLGKKVSQASVESIGFFSAKRIIVESSLALMDAFPADKEDLYDWYALLSAELAGKLEWKNKVRKFQVAREHKSWAIAVPIQHIKSEVIIKLHKVLNQINS